MNFTDRAYLIFFICNQHAPAPPDASGFRLGRVMLCVNLGCAFLVLFLAVNARDSSVWRFFHNWYPLSTFIVGFEEVSRLSFLLVDWKLPSPLPNRAPTELPEPPEIFFLVVSAEGEAK